MCDYPDTAEECRVAVSNDRSQKERRPPQASHHHCVFCFNDEERLHNEVTAIKNDGGMSAEAKRNGSGRLKVVRVCQPRRPATAFSSHQPREKMMTGLTWRSAL